VRIERLIMQSSSPNAKYRIMADINMIPLIDVALVLLIIFMIMTPFLIRSQINLRLPTSRAVDPKVSRDKAVTVQVARDGALYADGQSVDSNSVERVLRNLLRDPQTTPLLVEADKDASFQYVVVVLDAAKRIGAAKLGVCVRKESKGGRR